MNNVIVKFDLIQDSFKEDYTYEAKLVKKDSYFYITYETFENSVKYNHILKFNSDYLEKKDFKNNLNIRFKKNCTYISNNLGLKITFETKDLKVKITDDNIDIYLNYDYYIGNNYLQKVNNELKIKIYTINGVSNE